MFLASGYPNVLTYRYLNKEMNVIDFKGFCEDISSAPQNSVIILHACGHNPTGLDISKDQWKIIAEIIKVRHIQFEVPVLYYFFMYLY